MKSDNQLQQDVISQIQWHPFLQSSEIGVSVKNGIVILSGNVDSFLKKVEVEKAVKKVEGVKAVVLDIHVGISPGNQRTDSEIAEAVINSLRWHTSIPEENITVKIEKGIVTLSGTVDWEFQRHSAKNVVSSLAGVNNVINLIQIKPGALIEDIKEKITNAFQRIATVDADKISIVISDDKVILTGSVSSHAEKEDAESAAWSAPGITKVENLLQVASEEYSL